MKQVTFALLGFLPLLTACVVEEDHYGRPGPGYRGRTVVEYNHYDDRDRYYYRDRDDDYDGDHRDHWHCPPGQAKKGNC